jgi:NAD(P)H-flavin reductase
MICDALISTEFTGIISLGHFILSNTAKKKCFIGTGTGFAPLYAMIEHISHHEENTFLYGVRELRDFFYFDEMK